MYPGKKIVAQQYRVRALELIKQRANDDPLKVFKKAVDNVKPALEVKSRRVGGANYQVPVEVNRNRQTSLSLRWIIGYARDRGEKSMVEKLAAELAGCSQQSRRRHQEEGRYSPHGRSQQGFCPLPLVILFNRDDLEQGGMWRPPDHDPLAGRFRRSLWLN